MSENSVLIFYKDEPFIVILVHRIEFLSMCEVLNKYAEFSGMERKHFSGKWIKCIDITNTNNGIADQQFARNDWPQSGAVN